MRKLILMDEPTAAISVRQVAEVLSLIQRLKDAGIAVILISHRMPDVFAVCERVIVMRRGTKVADKPIAKLLAGRGDGPDHRREGSSVDGERMRFRASPTCAASASGSADFSPASRPMCWWR
jgi:energy-coupling factor transporter ATP-binding protein EcfA2